MTQIKKPGFDERPGFCFIIAVTAAQYGAVLVHRDAHFTTIPSELTQQRLVG